MTLTAGRIWWIRRETFHVDVDPKFRNRYDTAITIIVESGVIYCACGILALVSGFFVRVEVISYGIAYGLLRQGINIIPTLIVVWVGLGHNIQDTIRDRIEKSTPRHTPIFLEDQEVLDIKPMERK
ncbi:hypothetical protein C8R44DRAFT_822110 [Mycena epipterygia]|nr:hypothetical protein C8R44DRAFT_822110 [Mycena epipterygia]